MQRRRAATRQVVAALSTLLPLTLVAAVAAGLLQAARAGRAYIQRSCQERKHQLGPMQELGAVAVACGPPVELYPHTVGAGPAKRL